MVEPVLAVSGAAVNLPLLVAGVFAATFLVVCALAYVFLGRAQSRAGTAPLPSGAIPDPPPANVAAFDRPDAPASLDASPSGALSIETISRSRHFAPAADPGMPLSASATTAPATPLDPGKATILRLYRLLMFLTGGTGLVATYLMWTAVEGFSRLLVIALIVFALSLAALYRGVIPDPELTGKK